MNHPFFYLSFCLLLVHEMDAIRCHEWRIFPLLSRLDDETGYLIFTAAHVPLYGFLFWKLFEAGALNEAWAAGLSGFSIVHAGLHWLLRNHPRYEFNSAFSKTLIGGAGLAGALAWWIG